jgi:Protein of unknown function (DUF3224)
MGRVLFFYPRAFLRTSALVAFVLGTFVAIAAFATFVDAQTENHESVQKKDAMTQHASGPFDVKLLPQKPDSEVAEAAKLGRMSVDKQYHGDLEATSKGEMIATQTEVKGSAGYVAMERVTGTLKGRKGSFVLQHSATMNRGVPELSITVVPDSGTGELTGLAGKMNIIITDGKHSYEFDYMLADKP